MRGPEPVNDGGGVRRSSQLEPPEVLREAGLVDGERRGTRVYYWPVPAKLAALSDLLAVTG